MQSGNPFCSPSPVNGEENNDAIVLHLVQISGQGPPSSSPPASRFLGLSLVVHRVAVYSPPLPRSSCH
eukprot:scaffold16438_cov144-Isochrysis_galbana.AAC.6